MNEADHCPHGVPCWVDTWQPDPMAARAYYGSLFGWQYHEVALSGGGAYLNASLGGRLVSGIGQGPPDSPAVWSVYIGVEDIESAIERIVGIGGRPLTETVELAPEGRMAILADCNGVPFGLWEGQRRARAQVVGRPNSWAMSALHSPDLSKSEQFYGDAFGWDLVRHPGSATGLSAWRAHGRTVAVATPTDGVSVPAHWAINFAVADVDEFAQRARALGATLLIPPMDTPGFRSVVIADPQGGVIAASAVRA